MNTRTLIADSASLIKDLLSQVPHESQSAIAHALDHGCELGVLITVIPKPKVSFLLVEPEGAASKLLEIEISQCKRH
jgi:hypothetical protein